MQVTLETSAKYVKEMTWNQEIWASGYKYHFHSLPSQLFITVVVVFLFFLFFYVDLPKPQLSIESKWKTFYPSEKVILKCSINSNEWAYEWFRNRDQLSGDDDISFSGNTLSISSAKASHSGHYTCRGKHLKRTSVITRQAEALQLRIHGKTS